MATPSPDEASLPALAAQVASLRDQVADLRGDVRTTKARVEAAGMAGGGIRLREEVAALARAVAALTGDGPVPRAVAPNWLDLTGDDLAEALADLAAWVVGFLATNYPHARVRACWADHPPAIWELSTLRAEWQRVYERPHPDLPGALAWHDRWLPGVIDRLEKILHDCKAGCVLTVQAPARPRPRVR
jgi:hypothetical protein